MSSCLLWNSHESRGLKKPKKKKQLNVLCHSHENTTNKRGRLISMEESKKNVSNTSFNLNHFMYCISRAKNKRRGTVCYCTKHHFIVCIILAIPNLQSLMQCCLKSVYEE